MNYARKIICICLLPGLICLCVLLTGETAISAEVNLEYCTSTLWSGWGSVVVEGDYAYCSAALGLAIFDVENPSQPIQIGTCLTPASGKIELAGTYVYMAAGWSGMIVIDVSDPTAPEIVGDVPPEDWPTQDVQVEGDYAYLADKYLFKVVSLKYPTSPEVLGKIYFTGSVYSITVSGKYAYAIVNGQGLRVIDISDPADPVALGRTEINGSGDDMAVKGRYAYLANGCPGIEIVDISDPELPVIISTLDTPGWASGIAVHGQYAFVADGISGVQVVDVSDPAAPLLVASCFEPDEASEIAVKGGHAYVADRRRGLDILDISPVSDIHQVGCFIGGSRVLDIVASGDVAHVANGYGGFISMDISDPQKPTVQGETAAEGFSDNVAVWDNFAFLSDWHYGYFHVIDVSDPQQPEVVYFDRECGFTADVAACGDYVALTTYYGGVRLYHIANSGQANLLSTSDGEFYNGAVVLTDDYAYVAADDLYIIDVSDKKNPKVIGHCDTPGRATELALRGSHILVADAQAGLQVVDVSDPEAPVLVGSCYYPITGAIGVTAHGNYAYVADGTHGVVVIDVSDPTTPTFAGEFDTPGEATNLAVQGEYVYVACDCCLMILHQTETDEILLSVDSDHASQAVLSISNHPNPFNPSTTIEYSLPERANVNVSIYNLLGRRVVTLVDRTIPAGTHQVVWEGKDESGAVVATGVYLYRVQAGEVIESRKMVLLK